jgi:hypothetical protein
MKLPVASSLFACAVFAACCIVSTRASAASPLPPPPEWHQLYFSHEDSNTALAHDVSSETGNTKYYFDLPQHIASLHVSLTDAGGVAGTSFVMRHGSPTGKVVCQGVQSGDAKKCGLVGPREAGRYFIEATTAPAHAELLAVSYVLPFVDFEVPEGRPFSLAARTAFHSEDTPHCLESRNPQSVQGKPIAEALCLPMGGPQQWMFEYAGYMRSRIRNVASGLCLGTENQGTAIGTRVVELACIHHSTQIWHVSGSGGFRQYARLYNEAADECLEFQGGEARIGECYRAGGNHAAWAIRGEEERMKSFPLTGGVLEVLRGLRCASNDVRWVMLDTCGPPNTRYLFAPTHYFGGGQEGDGQFVIAEANGDDSRCMTVIDHPDGFRYANMADCDTTDLGQRWSLVADVAHWQLRNARTGQCLNAKGGASEKGTLLITWACAPSSDNARWRYLQL